MESDGALGNNYLEHFDLNDLLENLEEWERYLQSDPEVAHRLKTFEPAAPKAPSLRGPRP